MKRNYPNLFIPGAGKSGTSSLHYYLSQHDEICMSKIKEPHYFSNEKLFEKKEDFYLSLFEECESKRYRGESSTGYLAFPNVIERIKKYCENPKFIFVLRNPVDRAVSHYNWLIGLGAENRPFFDAFLADYDEVPDPLNTAMGLGYKYYYQWGRYGHWIERYINRFGLENIHILTTESLSATPIDAVNGCFDFLGLKRMQSINTSRENETTSVKHKSLARYLWRANDFLMTSSLTRIARSYAPSAVKKLYQHYGLLSLRKLVMKKKGQLIKPIVHQDERERIASHYRTDVDKLRKLTRMAFNEWKDFSSKPENSETSSNCYS